MKEDYRNFFIQKSLIKQSNSCVKVVFYVTMVLILNVMTIAEIFEKLCIMIEGDTVGFNIVKANIATVNDDDANLERSPIIFSVVNIEEDKTLKNQSLYKKKVEEGIISIDKYKKPAQNLIFSLLFSSYTKHTDQYSNGITKLEKVIRYLQDNNVFYFDDTGNFYEQTQIPSGTSPDSLHKIILDLKSLKIEELNQMWSYLNNKYMPSALYTMRLIRIQNEEGLPTAPVITEVITEVEQKSIE